MTPGDFGLALVGFVLLTVWQTPPSSLSLSVRSANSLALTGP